jgi:hypothetical protein
MTVTHIFEGIIGNDFKKYLKKRKENRRNKPASSSGG